MAQITAAQLVVEVLGNVDNLTASMTKAEEQMGRLGKASQALHTALKVGLFGAITSVVGGLGLAVKEASEAETNIAQLNAVLKSTGGVAGITYDHVMDLANALSQTTRYSDDAILSAENLLLTFTNIRDDVFTGATEIILDMSTALGQDLKSSAIQVGKALQDPIQGVTALRRVGVNFNKAQMEVIKNLVKSGKTMEAQKLILKELQTEFGGSAEAAGKTFAGQVDILKNRLLELAEGIGMMLLPPLTRFLGWVNKGIDVLEKLGGTFEIIFDRIRRGGDVFSAIAEEIGEDFGPEVQGAVQAVLEPLYRLTQVMEVLKGIAVILSGPLAQAKDSLVEFGRSAVEELRKIVVPLPSLPSADEIKAWAIDWADKHIATGIRYAIEIGEWGAVGQAIGALILSELEEAALDVTGLKDWVQNTLIPDVGAALRGGDWTQVGQDIGEAIGGLISGLRTTLGVGTLVGPLVGMLFGGGPGLLVTAAIGALRATGLDTKIGEVLQELLAKVGIDPSALKDKVVQAIQGAIPEDISATLGDLGSKFGDFTGALSGAPESIDKLKGSFDPLKETLGAVGDKLTWVAEPVLGGATKNFQVLGETVGKLGEPFKGLVDSVLNYVGAFSETVTGFFQENGDEIVAALTTMAGTIGDILHGLGELWDLTFGQAFRAVIPVLGAILGWIMNLLTSVFNGIANFMREHGETIKAVLKGAWDFISGIVQGALDLIRGIINTVVALLKGDWEGAWNSIKDTVSRVWEDIKGAVSGAIEGLKTLVTDALNTLGETLGGIWEGIKTKAGEVWENLKKAVLDTVDSLKSKIKEKLDEASKTFSDIWDGFRKTIDDTWTKIKNAVIGGVNKVIDAINGLIDAYNSLAKTLGLPQLGHLQHLARGTPFWPGGPALVGERGPELVYLPRGSRVEPLMPQAAATYNYNLTIHTSGPPEPIISDFQLMQSWAGV